MPEDDMSKTSTDSAFFSDSVTSNLSTAKQQLEDEHEGNQTGNMFFIPFAK